MILSHMKYCLTSWTQTSGITLQSLERLYKQALKILDKRSNSYHHCKILSKFGFLSWENMIKFADILLVYKILHGMAPPPHNEFIKQNFNSSTRATTRGDCIIPHRRSAFGQSVFSYRAVHTWNTIPIELRNITSLASFSKMIKGWLLDNQICLHK